MRALCLALVALWQVVVANGTAAQDMGGGVWRGTLQLGGVDLSVTLTVADDKGSQSAVMRASDGPASEVSELVLESDQIAFIWGAFRCAASKSGSQFTGQCATSDGTTGDLRLMPPNAEVQDAIGTGGDVLTGDELRATDANDLYDAIYRLKPRWVVPIPGRRAITEGAEPTTAARRRAAQGITPARGVQVFVSGQRVGGVDVLRSYELSSVDRIRFFAARDAMTRFGGDNEFGVIEIYLR